MMFNSKYGIDIFVKKYRRTFQSHDPKIKSWLTSLGVLLGPFKIQDFQIWLFCPLTIYCSQFSVVLAGSNI